MIEMNIETLKKAIKESLDSMDCKSDDFLDMDRKRKHGWVSEFQKKLMENLNQVANNYGWETEYSSPEYAEQDSIDVYGSTTGSSDWIIEIDATRADQIAKKFVSRLALYGLKKSINYVAIMYPDTAKGKNECEKFLRYFSEIIKEIIPESVVYGLFINPDTKEIEQFDMNKDASK